MKIIIILAIVSVIIVFIIEYLQKKNKGKEEKYPYYRKNILTKNEWIFFKKLKEITDKNKLHILTKVRIIDIIDVEDNIPYKEKMKYKAKIIQKHLDFILVEPDSFKVYLAIELDDNSHNQKDRIERDIFVNKVCEVAKLPLIRCRNEENLEEEIMKIVNEEQNKISSSVLNEEP